MVEIFLQAFIPILVNRLCGQKSCNVQPFVTANDGFIGDVLLSPVNLHF